MAREHYVVGLDVGTTKICTVVARPTAGEGLEILGVGLSPSTGLKRGVVVDREQTTLSIRASVTEAERMAGLPVPAAFVGITGDHISSVNVTARVNVAGAGEVTQADMDRVLQSARDSVSLPADREIVHVAERQYVLDGVSGITRPVGMAGTLLDLEAHIVTGMSSIIRNLERCVQDAGVRIQQRVLEPIATATAVLAQAERDLGVILVDIGGGTTDIAVFTDGALCHTSAIPVAGNHVTRDLARVLRMSLEDAESLKRKWAVATPGAIAETEAVQIRRAGTDEIERIPRRLAAEITEPRLEEIFAMVQRDVRRSGVYARVAGGVVISGGGSQLAGTTHLASRVLDGLPVRVGVPRGLRGLGDAVSTPVHATAVGLALCAAEARAFVTQPVAAEPGTAGAWARLSAWVRARWPRPHGAPANSSSGS